MGPIRFIGLTSTIEAMQLNAKECHTKAGSITVDIELVEVDRRELVGIDIELVVYFPPK